MQWQHTLMERNLLNTYGKEWDDILYPGSKFNIDIDFKASHGAYVHDKNTGRDYLDFFGNYASSALGHRARDIVVPFNKINNCEHRTQEARDLARDLGWPYVSFCCTGGIAVDTAIKVALTQNNKPVYSFKKSFHGITGYGMEVTDHDNDRTQFPKLDWPQVDRLSTKVEGNVIVEPIQCAYGDLMRPKEWFEKIREKSEILIFDEVQTGFGATGTFWYYQQLGIVPDIVTFGKKAQVAGVLSKFPIPYTTSVTFDGHFDDIVRCRQVLKDYEEFHLIENARERGLQLRKGIKDSWGAGLITAFKATEADANRFYSEGLLVNHNSQNGIARLRPPMNVTEDEINKAIEIINA